MLNLISHALDALVTWLMVTLYLWALAGCAAAIARALCRPRRVPAPTPEPYRPITDTVPDGRDDATARLWQRLEREYHEGQARERNTTP